MVDRRSSKPAEMPSVMLPQVKGVDMGDRANIQVTGHADRDVVYLYTHWGGTELPETVQRGLERGKERWDDSQYLARILFCQFLMDYSEGVDGLTGFGISGIVHDGDTRIVEVDVPHQTVYLTAFGKQVEYSFADYVALDSISWPGEPDED